VARAVWDMRNISPVAVAVERAESLAEKAYFAIRGLIVSLELPPGSVLNERALTERLGIGRTPVREALRRLAQEQLVEVFPRRGMFVSTVEIRDLASLCEVRDVLESHAARLAAERATEAERDELSALIAELDRSAALDQRALMALDERIHRTVYRCAHNTFLAATLEEYYMLALRIWHLALDQARELEAAVHSHRALLEAIRDGKGERAAEIMRRHVDDFETVMHQVLLGVGQ
jgi:DNA-binding GntR family transcriptional regulator